MPSGYLSPNTTSSSSVPFTGTLINGSLYANTPTNTGLGNVVINNNGQLQVVSGKLHLPQHRLTGLLKMGPLYPTDKQLFLALMAMVITSFTVPVLALLAMSHKLSALKLALFKS